MIAPLADAPAVRRWPKWWLLGAAVFLLTSAVRLIVLLIFAIKTEQPLEALLSQWDVEHYVRIAENGYFGGALSGDNEQPIEYTSLAFFPALPGLMRVIAALTPLDAPAAGVLISVIAGIALAAGAAALADATAERLHLPLSQRARAAAAVLIVGAPMSITFTMVYTESLFGALAIWAVVLLMRRHWLAAGLLILLSGTVRLTAIDLIALMAVVVLLRARRELQAWLGLALTPWALGGYLWWASQHSQEVGGYFGLQRSGWHSSFDFGAATWRFLIQALFESRETGYFLSAVVIVAAVIAVLLSIGRAPVEVWLLSAAITANVVLSDGIMHSRPRLLLPAVVILLPWLLRRLPEWTRTGWWLAATAWVLMGAWFSGYLLAVFPWAI